MEDPGSVKKLFTLCTSLSNLLKASVGDSGSVKKVFTTCTSPRKGFDVYPELGLGRYAQDQAILLENVAVCFEAQQAILPRLVAVCFEAQFRSA